MSRTTPSAEPVEPGRGEGKQQQAQVLGGSPRSGGRGGAAHGPRFVPAGEQFQGLVRAEHVQTHKGNPLSVHLVGADEASVSVAGEPDGISGGEVVPVQLHALRFYTVHHKEEQVAAVQGRVVQGEIKGEEGLRVRDVGVKAHDGPGIPTALYVDQVGGMKSDLGCGGLVGCVHGDRLHGAQRHEFDPVPRLSAGSGFHPRGMGAAGPQGDVFDLPLADSPGFPCGDVGMEDPAPADPDQVIAL